MKTAVVTDVGKIEILDLPDPVPGPVPGACQSYRLWIL